MLETASTEPAGTVGHAEESLVDWNSMNIVEVANLAVLGLVTEVATAAVTLDSTLVTLSAAISKGPAVGQILTVNGETHFIHTVTSTTVFNTAKPFAATAAAGAVNTSIGVVGYSQKAFVTTTLKEYISPKSTTQFFGLDVAGIVYNVAAN